MSSMTLLLALVLGSGLLSELGFAGNPWEWQSPRNAYEEQGSFIGSAPSCNGKPSDCNNKGMNYWYSVTSGTGHYCSSGYKVYCNHQASPYVNLWWDGTAPTCNGQCSHCDNGAVCVATDGTGDGSDCSSGNKQKAFCVVYRSTSEQLVNSNYSDIVTVIEQGVDIGFYIFLGDEFDDDSLLEDRAVKDAYLKAVASALTRLVPSATSRAESAEISGKGYIDRSSETEEIYSTKFVNAKKVPFLNVNFYYSSETEAAAIESYLDCESNRDIFSNAVTNAVGTLFSDLGHKTTEVLFVEANTFVTDLQATCPVVGDGDNDNQSCN